MNKLGNDLWNNEQKKFDKDNVQVLLDHLTGKPNATMDDVAALFSGKPIYTNARTQELSGEGDPNGTYHQEYSSKVVKSDLLNRNANKITPGIGDNDMEKGLCITLKGKEFRVTSLTRTLPTEGNPDGDIVATLLLKEPEGKVQWNRRYNRYHLSPEPSNMYGTSDIRYRLISKDGWLESFVGEDVDFAVNYLVQPKCIGYQHEQSAATRWKDRWEETLANEALGDVGGISNNNYMSYDYYNNGGKEGSKKQLAKRNKYISWGDDYVWLPSLTEIGLDGAEDGRVISIWEILDDRKSWHDKRDELVWLRSSYDEGDCFPSMFCLNSSSEWSDCSVYNSLGLRPALHLNLSAILPS